MLLIFVIMFFMLLNNLFNISIIAKYVLWVEQPPFSKSVLLLIELEGLSLLLLLISAAFSKQEPRQ